MNKINLSSSKSSVNSESEFNKIALSKNDSEEIINKIRDMKHPEDYKKELNEGDLYEKYSSEFIKNIFFQNKRSRQNISFNFYEYTEKFSDSIYTKDQAQLFKELINFKESNFEEDKDLKNKEFGKLSRGEIDLIIYDVTWKEIKNVIEANKNVIFQCFNEKNNNESNFDILIEIKKNFEKDIVAKPEAKKQFIKYFKIIKLLTLEPELTQLKKVFGLTPKNKLAYMIVTNGQYNKFERSIRRFDLVKKYQEKFEGEEENYKFSKKYELFDLYLKNKIPIFVAFVPALFDDLNGHFKSKKQTKTDNELKQLRNEISELSKTIKELTNRVSELSSENNNMKNEIKLLSGGNNKLTDA